MDRDDNFRPFDLFTQASVTAEAPSPAPLNDNEIVTGAARFAQLWDLVAHKRLDALEKRRQSKW
jgi:hypothetical protein